MTRQLEVIVLLAREAEINARRGDGALPIQLGNGDYDFRGWRDVPRNWSTRIINKSGQPWGVPAGP
jgi:hypothetical protein